MKENSTQMIFSKIMMSAFILILSIHFFGFLCATNQIGSVDRLDSRVASIKEALSDNFGNLQPCRISYHIHEVGISPNGKLISVNRPPTPTSGSPTDAYPQKKNEVLTAENMADSIEVTEYWPPVPLPLKGEKKNSVLNPNAHSKEVVKKDAYHLKLFTNIVSAALTGSRPDELLKDNDSSTILLISISNISFVPTIPPERQLNPKAILNGKDLSITAVLTTKIGTKYILIICPPGSSMREKSSLQLGIGNPQSQSINFYFSKSDIHNRVLLLEQ